MDNNTPILDNDTIVRLREGDITSFNSVYKTYRSRLYANILKLVKSPEIALDILQDVFISMWNHRQKIDIEQSFESYIFKIAQNKVYDFFRKASRDKKLEETLIKLSASQEYNPIETFYLKENYNLLEQEIEKLPTKCKEVFKLCKIEGKSYNEVAILLNISTATINNHIVKATKMLKKNLSNADFLMLLFLFKNFF